MNMPEPFNSLYASTEAALRGKPQHVREAVIKELGQSLSNDLEAGIGPKLIALSRKRHLLRKADRSKAERALQQVEQDEMEVWNHYEEELAMARALCSMLALGGGPATPPPLPRTGPTNR